MDLREPRRWTVEQPSAATEYIPVQAQVRALGDDVADGRCLADIGVARRRTGRSLKGHALEARELECQQRAPPALESGSEPGLVTLPLATDLAVDANTLYLIVPSAGIVTRHFTLGPTPSC
jgi:hypothetical protein